MHDLTDAIAAAHAALDERFYPGPTEEMVRAAIEAAAPVIAAKALDDDRERWARETAQQMATTAIQSSAYIGRMLMTTVDALLAMARDDLRADGAAEALREFARNQDSWCEAGRANQVITRAAMRDALNARADAIEACCPHPKCPGRSLCCCADAIEAGQS